MAKSVESITVSLLGMRPGKTEDFPHSLEQQVPALRPHVVDALLQAAGKQIVFTAHNVNAGKRDSNDSWLNRLSLKIQYKLSDHIFVHTDGMKRETDLDFRIPESKVSVIPFGLTTRFQTQPLERRSETPVGRKQRRQSHAVFWKHCPL